MTAENPTTGTLRRLTTLRETPIEDLRTLANSLEIQNASKGTVLLQRGSDAPFTLFLINGALDLTAGDGASKRIGHSDPSALAPIARLRPSRYTVVAATPVDYLRIDNALLERLAEKDQQQANVFDNYQVDEQSEMEEMAAENQLTLHLYDQLNKGRLLLPSLPDVAVKVGRAINDEHIDARRMARLIEADPVIAAKIVKAANSPLYAGVREIGSVVEAVTRLGLQTTHHLVVALTLRELFRCHSALLKRMMQQLWTHSRKVAAICHVLARHVGGFDAEAALLGGLVHDIGTVAVLAYAREFPRIAEDEAQLRGSISYLRGQLGQLILTKWRMPVELAGVASDAENWGYDHPGDANYSDIVIIAQLHSLADEPADFLRPTLQQTPAYRKLGLNKGDEEESQLQILSEAGDEIRRVEELLGG